MTAQARQLYGMTRASGHGRDDYTSLMQFLEKIAGVEVRMKE
jgi:2-hydroxy-3-oxopropionate reductase/2-hydroxymethylglutarate dehydrogenase